MGRYKDRAKRFLEQKRNVDLEDETLALYPFTIYDYDYVLQIQSNNTNVKVTEVDGSVVTTLVMTYDLTVEKPSDGGGEE